MRAIEFVGPRKINLRDDVPLPVPKDGEVLVRCNYVALCGTNMGPYLYDGRWANPNIARPPGWLGHENIGTIVESRAAGWEPGTLVLAHPDDYNGFAEYICSKPAGLARLPDSPPDLCALVVAQPLATVLRAMVRTGPVINQRCAVLGQGPMGLIFTHLLSRMGARQVIGIDRVTWRLRWSRRFGATDVVDASREDVIKAVGELTGGKMVDFCVEASNRPEALATAAWLPRRQGRLYAFGVPHNETQEFPWFHTVANETEIITSMGPECMEYFQTAVDMIVQGRVDLVDMVTPRMPWEQAAEAFEMYAEPEKAEDSLKLTLVLSRRTRETGCRMIEYTASDTLAVLCLRAPPVNALNIAVLEELLAAIRRAADDPRIRAVVITGGPEQFSAGADLAVFREIGSAEEAVRVSQVFQAAFQQIEDSPKPVVAALAGHVMGSGLELALACHFRVAAEGSRFSMPEVRLGINPGAGGTQRLPRLVGLEAAVDMLLTGQPIRAERALALGLVTAVCAPDTLVLCAASVCSHPGRKTRECHEKIQDAVANQAAFAKAEKLVAAVRPEIVAPGKIAEAIRIGIEQSFEAGLRREQLAFAECMATRATQNKIYLFFATRQTAKIADKPEQRGAGLPAVPRVARAGVLGMGTMGAGIAQAIIAAGISVTGCDESQAALDRALEKIRVSLDGRVRQGKLTAEQAEQMIGRLRLTTDYQALADSQLVVEAVFENAEVKRDSIAQLEELCAVETLIATNTSTLNLDLLAADMRQPDRLVGMHFFHPAQHMPLVEIIRRKATPPQVVTAAVRFARGLGKTPVLVRNREGFVVNRLFLPYLKEAFWLLEEGVEPAAIDRAIVDFGFAMGPLVLIDMSGLDILVLTDTVLQGAFPKHGPLSSIALSLVERGCLGQKTGSGVYQYEQGDRTPRTSEVAVEIIAKARRARGELSADKRSDEIVSRLVLRMVAEAFRVVEGIVERPADIDVAMVLGTGLADFRGGVLKYACDVGLDHVLGELEELAGLCGERYAPCDLLRAAAADPRALKL